MPAPETVVKIENRSRNPLTLDVAGLKLPAGTKPIRFGCSDDRRAEDGRPLPVQEIPEKVWEAVYARQRQFIDAMIASGDLVVY